MTQSDFPDFRVCSFLYNTVKLGVQIFFDSSWEGNFEDNVAIKDKMFVFVFFDLSEHLKM